MRKGPYQIAIIGDLGELGMEFARLALADQAHLMLVGTDESLLEQQAHRLSPLDQQVVGYLPEDLAQPGADARIYEAWLLQSLLHTPPLPIRLLINILRFHSWQGTGMDPWMEEGPESAFHLENLLGLNHWFAQEMQQQAGGHILNVLIRPDGQPGPLQDMFLETQALFHELGQQADGGLLPPQVAISTLSVSGQAFELAASHKTDDAAPVAGGGSWQDIAGVGYQYLRRVA